MEDKDLATFAIPLDSFTKAVKLSGQEMEKKHQDLIKGDVVVEFNGAKYVMLSRYISFVLDDLKYLYLRARTFRSEKAIEDYAFISERYLEIWARIMLGRSQFVTSSGEKVSDDNIRDTWENALDYFQAIYRYTRDAIVISLENGPLAGGDE